MEKKEILYYDKQLLPKFILEYITYFFFYGYLFFTITIVLSFFLYFLLQTIQGLEKYISLILLIPIGYAFVRFILILASTNYKWRFYRISNYRLKTRGFNENYFKYEMYEPCMRLIVKNLLYKYGYRNEYKEMLEKYIKVDQRVEDAKNRLLESVMHDDIKKINMQEDCYGKTIQS